MFGLDLGVCGVLGIGSGEVGGGSTSGSNSRVVKLVNSTGVLLWNSSIIVISSSMS